MLLSPISLIGRVNKISSSWMVLTKPVRHRMLYDTMHRTIAADRTDKDRLRRYAESKTGGHVLVVEESLPVAQLLQNILTEDGYHVALAKNSEQAMQFIHRVQYDLCLMALPLSGDVDICTITQEIRTTEAEKKSPRLAIVGVCATEFNKQQLVQSGEAPRRVFVPLSCASTLASRREHTELLWGESCESECGFGC